MKKKSNPSRKPTMNEVKDAINSFGGHKDKISANVIPTDNYLFLREGVGVLPRLPNSMENNRPFEVIFGWGDLNPQAVLENEKNVKYEGFKSHEEIAEIFKKSKAVFHSPIVNEPFCRMIGEALLCGVEEIIGDNEKIGAYTEFKKVGYDKFKEGCETAAETFWESIKKI